MADMVGRTLGSYKITGKIGQGGMANVYRATQPSIGREVAIKVLPPHFLQDPTFVKRFSREVQVIAKLQHPHILPVYDFGQEGGTPYIVMAYITGGTLTDYIRKAGALPLAEVVRLTEQIASGLDHAHQKGIVHRDFKPSNVLLDENKNVYLADFGIAKVAEGASQITGSGIIGTPAYMAPEATQTSKVTSLVDIYALGVTLFEMLAGEHPYPSETPVGVLMAHAAQPIPDMLQHRPDLPPGVQAVIDRAMAKDPKARYQNAGALAADLRSVMANESPLTEAVSRPAGSGLDGTVRLGPTGGPAAAAPSPNRTLAIIGGVAAVAVVAVAAALAIPGLLTGSAPGQTPTVESAAPTEAIAPTSAPTGEPSGSGGDAGAQTGHTDSVNSVVFSPDGKLLATGSADQTVILWDAGSGEPKETLETPDKVYSMAFYPDGKTLVVGGENGLASYWDTANGEQLNKQEFLPAGQISVAVAPDQSIYAIALRDVNVPLFAAADYLWQKVQTFSGPVWTAAFSPDSAVLAAGLDNGTIALRELATDQDRFVLEGHTGGVRSLAFSPDGKLLASTSTDQTVILWDVETGEKLFALEGHTGTVYAAAWSPDGKQVASASKDGLIIVWDAATGQESSRYEGSGAVGGVAFSPDGTLLAAGMDDGEVVLRKLE